LGKTLPLPLIPARARRPIYAAHFTYSTRELTVADHNPFVKAITLAE
jgi:hypothetical protein